MTPSNLNPSKAIAILTELDIPEGWRADISHLSEQASVNDYGPGGRGDAGAIGAPETAAGAVATWHVVLIPVRTCPTCRNNYDSLWFKGHGMTLAEAWVEALSGMQAHLAAEFGKGTPAQNPPESHQY